MNPKNENSGDKKIQFKTKTWKRDSHGLFDYENNQVKSVAIIVDSNGLLIRKNDDLKFLNSFNQNETNLEDSKILGSLDQIGGKFYLGCPINTMLPVNNQTLTDLQDKIWHVVKTNNSNSSVVNSNKSFMSNYVYELKKNDIIKLGRIKFVVKDMNIVEGSFTTTQEIFKPYQDIENKPFNEVDMCRICWMGFEKDQIVVSLCKCKGSLDMIHMDCLKGWLETKRSEKIINGKFGVSYTIKSFNCEICKDPYPTTLKYEDEYYNLMNYTIPKGENYIILESLNSIKENQYPLSVHVLSFIDNNEFFILGRGHESDVRISDISVSRIHAKIFMKEGKYYLEDTGSKFGTLILSKDQIEINSNPQILQIGRTLVSTAEVDISEIGKKGVEYVYEMMNYKGPTQNDGNIFDSQNIPKNHNHKYDYRDPDDDNDKQV